MPLTVVVWVVVMILFVLAYAKARRRGRSLGSPGPGAAGAIYDLLNQDKRNAIEIIVEEKAEERDPESADGNLPELESPRERR